MYHVNVQNEDVEFDICTKSELSDFDMIVYNGVSFMLFGKIGFKDFKAYKLGKKVSASNNSGRRGTFR